MMGLMKANKDEKHRQWPPNGDLVLLGLWSDVTFLEWQQQCSDTDSDIKGLKWIMRRNVMNREVESVLPKVLKKNGVDSGLVGKWDQRVVLGPESEGFNTVCGTPNGSGVLYFLWTHREQLGRMEVKSITIWSDDQGAVSYAPTLVFEVGAVEGGG